jgi:Na+-translocating ferredoxin:NAD+ oxidoreductase subunit E
VEASVSAAPGRVPLLALLLAVSPALLGATRGVNGLVLGAVVLAVLVLSTLAVTLAGSRERPRSAIFLDIALVAVLATAADLLVGLWAPRVRADIGIALELTAAGCVVVERAIPRRPAREAGRAVADAAAAGLGIAACLFAVACLREAFGYGTITLLAIGRFPGVVTLRALAAHPSAVARGAAGGLLVLGFLLGLGRWIAQRRSAA